MREMILTTAGLCTLTIAVGCQPGDPLARRQGVDLNGSPANPFDGEDKVTVLVFVGCDCPISNRYVPTLRAMRERYSGQSVRFWFVYPDPDVSTEQIKQHLAEYAPEIPALRDPSHNLVQAASVTTIPEAAVFVRHNRQLALAYHGSIDDQFVDFGVARARATKNHLGDVIELILAGRAEVFPRSQQLVARFRGRGDGDATLRYCRYAPRLCGDFDRAIHAA